MEPLTKQVTAFIDLLGFKDALNDHNRLNQILGLQQIIRGNAGDYQRRAIDDSGAAQIRAALSAFSDHFLISMPSVDEKSKTKQTAMIPNLIGFYAATIATEALKINMLMRGGLCEDQLYHENNIAFGPALVRAYEIESTQAFYPRIVLDPDFATALGEAPFSYFMFRDYDGSACLDYVTQMIGVGAGVPGGTPNDKRKEMTLRWQQQIREIAKRNIEQAVHDRSNRALQNWRYFAADVERAIARYTAMNGG